MPWRRASSTWRGRGHFNGRGQAGFGFHALQPGQRHRAHALKRARPGARLPDAGPEQVDFAQRLQAAGRGQHLLLGFGRARAGNEQRLAFVGQQAGKIRIGSRGALQKANKVERAVRQPAGRAGKRNSFPPKRCLPVTFAAPRFCPNSHPHVRPYAARSPTQAPPISFDDTRVAFASKSDAQLRKMYALFAAMNNGSLVKTGSGLMQNGPEVGPARHQVSHQAHHLRAVLRRRNHCRMPARHGRAGQVQHRHHPRLLGGRRRQRPELRPHPRRAAGHHRRSPPLAAHSRSRCLK